MKQQAISAETSAPNVCLSYIVFCSFFNTPQSSWMRQNGIGDLIKDAEETSTGALLKAATACMVFVTWRENIKTYSPILPLFSLSHFLLLLSIFPLRRGRGILMLSQTMDNLGDFLCASVIWFCPEAVLFQSLLSGWPELWKSDFPLSPLPFSCGLCEWAESAAIVVWFGDLSIGSNDWGLDVQC